MYKSTMIIQYVINTLPYFYAGITPPLSLCWGSRPVALLSPRPGRHPRRRPKTKTLALSLSFLLIIRSVLRADHKDNTYCS